MIEFIKSLGFIKTDTGIYQFSNYIITANVYSLSLYKHNKLVAHYYNDDYTKFKYELIKITKHSKRKNKLKNILID